MENAILEPKLVGKIEGEFYIPNYQRGYRWDSDNVNFLLNDIYDNGEKNYSLQPIVVKKMEENKYELIDGQQRLTTLYLIFKYMKTNLPNIELKFFMDYQTRTKSTNFLENLNEKEAEDNIDFHHIYNAYKTIEDWFTNKDIDDDDTSDDTMVKCMNIYRYLNLKVSVIWYQVNSTIKDEVALFTRLNIGKIPLTNAELVKALFLSKDEEVTQEKQLEISTSWDIIERDLQHNDFWSFLSNVKPEKYATRIELIFDLMANKPTDEKEKFYTFFYFSKEIDKESKLKVWKEIQAYYLLLKEWFENRDIYHKIGYLVAIGNKLQTIVAESKSLTKSNFKASLDTKIINSLSLSKEDILDLSYDKKNDKSKIDRVLLLFNVETVRLLQNSKEKYSFENYKTADWSLEHIHAQNSEGLNKKEDQQEWIKLHKKSLLNLPLTEEKKADLDTLIIKMDAHYDELTKVIFDEIFNEVFELLSENEDRSYIDSISNMALLSMADNAALNNSTFDVKRNKILEMDKKGNYIPVTTRRVFLKYYSNSENNQLHFWGQADREAYVNAMIAENGVITKYLTINSENN
ncbi:MAG: DUF262 domain-containing protein [Chitinophagales bacterium]